MFKGHLPKLFLFSTAFITGCGTPSSFSKSVAASLQTGNGSGSSGTLSTQPVVCDPFSQASGTSVGVTGGLQATLSYLPVGSDTVTLHGSTLTTASFAQGKPDVQVDPSLIYLNKVYVPTENFTDGFTDGDGTVLTDLNGQVLNQYFSLHIDANIQLNSNDVEGNYQFGILADDGALLTLSPNGVGGTMQTWVNIDGVHSNAMGCARQTVNMTRGKPFPIHLDYFQGPPVSIALVLLWRLNPSAALLSSDSASRCGLSSGDNFYFDTSTLPPTPLAPWNLLTSHPLTSNPTAGTGWQVVPAANFYLQNGATNPCVATSNR